jgi:hypothetical protein
VHVLGDVAWVEGTGKFVNQRSRAPHPNHGCVCPRRRCLEVGSVACINRRGKRGHVHGMTRVR